MPGLKPGDCGSAVRSIQICSLKYRGSDRETIPLTRPSVLGNPLRIMAEGHFQPLIFAKAKNGSLKHLKPSPKR